MKMSFPIVIRLLIALALLILPVGAWAAEEHAEEENLLKNAAFEADSGAPYDWELLDQEGAPPPGEVGPDTEAGQNGKSCVRIVHPGEEEHYTLIRQRVQVTPGAKYTWKARFRTEGLVSKGGNTLPAAAGIYTARGDTISFERADTRGEWQDVEQTFEMPEGVDSAQFLIYFDAQEGTFWIEQPVLVLAE